MQPQVDFYILQDTTERACHLLICKLAAKAFAAKQHLYIHCVDQQQALTLDDMLWHFNDISFLPHRLTSAESNTETPIVIGCATAAEQNGEILLNLHPEIPANLEKFKRIIEIVYQDATIKKISRAHYKTYQSNDFPLKSYS